MGSAHSKTAPVLKFDPLFFEFTGTKGVLRCLKPAEDLKRAKGLLFLCPRCQGHKKKEHYLTFIFDFGDIDPELRPPGRFSPKMHDSKKFGAYVPVPFPYMTLQDLQADDRDINILIPGDVKCGWTGSLIDGNVTWEPTFAERWRRK